MIESPFLQIFIIEDIVNFITVFLMFYTAKKINKMYYPWAYYFLFNFLAHLFGHIGVNQVITVIFSQIYLIFMIIAGRSFYNAKYKKKTKSHNNDYSFNNNFSIDSPKDSKNLDNPIDLSHSIIGFSLIAIVLNKHIDYLKNLKINIFQTSNSSSLTVNPSIIATIILISAIFMLLSSYWMLKVYFSTRKFSDLFLFITVLIAQVNVFYAIFNSSDATILLGAFATGMNLLSASLGLTTVVLINTEFRLELVIDELHTNAEVINQQIEFASEIMEQLSSTSEILSTSTEEINASSENVASTQQQISKGASKQVVSINQIQGRLAELNNGIKNIKKMIEEISHISSVIEELSNKTNMLALNAAIEAARAGEAGRGFSVVADNVRSLAQLSRAEASRTDKMVEQIVETTIEQEKHSLEILEQIDMIASVSEEISASTEESAAAAEEQASSMESVTQMATQLRDFALKVKSQIDELQKLKMGIEHKRFLNLSYQKPEKAVKFLTSDNFLKNTDNDKNYIEDSNSDINKNEEDFIDNFKMKMEESNSNERIEHSF